MRPNYDLPHILSELVKRARQARGGLAVTRLRSHLWVEVRLKGGFTYLTISRASTYPSLEEWQEVTGCWPHPVFTQPRRAVQPGRCCLTGCWRDDPHDGLPGS